MDLNQNNHRNYFKLIKAFLFVLFGIVIGAGVMFMIFGNKEAGYNQKAKDEISAIFQNDLGKFFPEILQNNSITDVRIIEEGEDEISVLSINSLSDEQIKIIYGTDPEEMHPIELEQLKKILMIAQAKYFKKDEEWKLKEDPEVYQSIPLGLFQESLGGARDRAKDARIQADLAQLRSVAEIHYNDNGYSYSTLAVNEDWITLASDINEQSPGNPVLYNSNNAYCAYSQLNVEEGKTQYYCVDSTGTAKSITTYPGGVGYCDGTTFICPSY